jgi:phosphoribosyl-AMP cyclohydrolase
VNELEEGTKAAIGFGKVQQAAASPEALVPVVLQDADSHHVLYLGYANQRALDETLATGTATLWSTSRDELWRKGASSGDVLDIVEVRVNCEQNSLLYLVRPRAGGACHTREPDGSTRPTCYYRRFAAGRNELEFVEGFSPSA